MKKEINDLLLKMQTGENCVIETANVIWEERNKAQILEAKILQWYAANRDENFAAHFGITAMRTSADIDMRGDGMNCLEFFDMIRKEWCTSEEQWKPFWNDVLTFARKYHKERKEFNG